VRAGDAHEAGALVGEAGKGFRAVFAGLNPERVTAAAISNGISRYALERATRYARERTVWQTPIGAHQGVAHPLAECYIAVAQARLLTARAAELADTLDAYTTFGRVRPDQKRAIVAALQSHGHTVAMTGDGVNDVLALKDADIGVAMGAGSPASRAVAQIVLLDNRFATLPYVVGEGRRVIGNIERVANLFLTKTIYSALLALFVGAECLVAKPLKADPLLYPFQPIHVTIAAWFTIGIPSFILSLAPNNERAFPGFVGRVLTSALPSGVIVGVATFVSYLLAYHGRHATFAEQDQASTAALITLLVCALWVLAVVARPYQWWRVALVVASGLAYVVIFSLPWAQQKFLLDPSNLVVTSTALGIGVLGAAAIEAAWWIRARMLGVEPQLWRQPPTARITAGK